MGQSKWTKKELLDSFISYNLTDLYTTIAGITKGYISVIQRDFGYTKQTAQEEILKLDKMARDRVADAFHIYDKMKDDEK